MNDFKDKNIWIIGASSGIGKALAQKLDKDGAKLALSARNEDDLNELNTSLDGEHSVFPLDVADYDVVKKTAQDIHEHFGSIDSAITLAAIYDPTLIRDMDIEKANKAMQVNIGGVINFTTALLPIMRKQGRGQIAITGSVAGYRGLPKGQPYSASKAAVMSFVESLRAEEQELDIRLISPGFVKTRLTEKNDFDMPMAIEADEAANHIAKGLLSNQYEIHFPKTFTYIIKALQIMPNFLYLMLANQMMKKMRKNG